MSGNNATPTYTVWPTSATATVPGQIPFLTSSSWRLFRRCLARGCQRITRYSLPYKIKRRRVLRVTIQKGKKTEDNPRNQGYNNTVFTAVQ